MQRVAAERTWRHPGGDARRVLGTATSGGWQRAKHVDESVAVVAASEALSAPIDLITAGARGCPIDADPNGITGVELAGNFFDYVVVASGGRRTFTHTASGAVYKLNAGQFAVFTG